MQLATAMVVLLQQVADSAKRRKGTYAASLRVYGQDRHLAAAALRDRGVAIMSLRAGGNSSWHLLSEASPAALRRHWKDRILGDFYTEAVRGARALSALSSAREEMHVLQSAAVQVGTLLGKDPATVLTETRPAKRPTEIQDILDDVARALGGP